MRISKYVSARSNIMRIRLENHNGLNQPIMVDRGMLSMYGSVCGLIFGGFERRRLWRVVFTF